MIPALITALLWSYCIIPARQLVRQVGENWANFSRLVLSVIVLGLISHLFGSGFATGAVFIFILSGVLGFGLGDIGMIYALPRIGSRLTILMAQCVAVPIAGIGEWLWLGTVIEPMQIVSITVTLGGVWMALAPSHLDLESKRRFISGISFGLLAAFGQATGAILSRKGYLELSLIETTVTDPSVIESILQGASTGYFRLIGGVLTTGLFLLIAIYYLPWRSRAEEKAGSDPLRAKAKNLILTSMAGPMVGIICFQWALATTPSGIVQAIVSLTPLVILPMTWYFEGDRPSMRSVIGSVIAVAGVLSLI